MCLDLPPITERDLVGDWDTIPLFIGVVLFAYAVITLVLPLKNQMANPESIGKPLGVINVGMTISTIAYVLLGFVSYWHFGDDILGSVTLNFDNNLM